MVTSLMLVSLRRIITWVLFCATLSGFLYLALVPNVQRDILEFLPLPLRRWCGANDDLNNALGFGVFAFLAFRLNGPRPSRRTVPSALGRLAGLMGLVAALEIAQFWIPGRFSSFRDVLTGWGGVLAAWVFSRWADRIHRDAHTKVLDSEAE